MIKSAQYWIDKLKMQPHPEGGYFKEVYRADEQYNGEYLPDRFGGDRSYGTSIYFLLIGEQVSKFHRIKSDEIWHFYEGSPVKIYRISLDGNKKEVVVGRDPDKGENLQTVIDKGDWFGAEVLDKNSYSLCGCTVAPGFHFEDFELADSSLLLRQFPQYTKIILKLT